MTANAPLLLIDAGNSRVKWAWVPALPAVDNWPSADTSAWRTGAFAHETQPAQNVGTVHALAGEPAWANLPRPTSIWISNVAGAALMARLDALIDAHWPGVPRAQIHSCAQQCGVTNRYDVPRSLGSDRWAALIGARASYPGEHLLIATFGTATTTEALQADGVFIGGLIAPGLGLMLLSLGQHTAQLPALTPHTARAIGEENDDDRQSAAFRRDTPTSIVEGCRLAQSGLVEEAWRTFGETVQAPVRCLIGGGAAQTIAPALSIPHTRHDGLVLTGLAVIAAEALGQTSAARVVS
ncbi:MAG: type III pantothenate kinase [Janthinobacterium lividum]